jgi:hypothetical protein
LFIVATYAGPFLTAGFESKLLSMVLGEPTVARLDDPDHHVDFSVGIVEVSPQTDEFATHHSVALLLLIELVPQALE